jgi:hypothetical protein
MAPRLRALPALLVAGLVAAGCGGSSGGSSGNADSPGPSSSTAKPQEFPHGTGLSFDDMRSRYPEQLALAIGASVMRQGVNRIPFVVLDKGARPVTGAPVALYTVRNDGTGVRGPFPAHEQTFGVRPPYISKTSAPDLVEHKTFYVADVPFKGTPPQGIFGLVRQDGRLVLMSPSPLGAKLQYPAPPPDVGQKAISVHTLTLKQVKDPSKLTTRNPPDTDLLQDDLANVLGHKPVVFIVATPALCQSRVCGPVVDVAEQVKAAVGNKVAFIHQEVYKDNQVNKGLRPQLEKYRLASEPWIFVIDRKGRITSRLEGAVSVPELRAAVNKVL